jgi:hypothetical protein
MDGKSRSDAETMDDGLGSAGRGRSALVLLVITPIVIVVVLLLNH